MSLSPNPFDTARYVDAPAPTPRPVPVPIPTPAVVQATGESFTWGIIGGVAGAIAGTILYVAFIEATHIRIGYLSIAVAFLVAKGMMVGSKSKGGFQYQVSAVLLTYLSVAVGNAVVIYTVVSKSTPVELNLHNILTLLRYGADDPIRRFQSSGLGAVLGLIILFVGLRAAWRMTSGDPEAMNHPFAR